MFIFTHFDWLFNIFSKLHIYYINIVSSYKNVIGTSNLNRLTNSLTTHFSLKLHCKKMLYVSSQYGSVCQQLMLAAENTHHRGTDHCMVVLHLNMIGFD